MALVWKPPFVQTPRVAALKLVNGTGTTITDVLAAGSLGTRIDKIGASSNDTAARVVQIYLTNGGVDYLLGSVSVSALAGNDGATAGANFLNTSINPLIVDGILTIPTGWTLRAAVTTAVTAAKTLTVWALGGDF